MKRLALAAALCAALPGVVQAEAIWVGESFVTGSNCSTIGIGDNYRSVYRPAGGALGNSADSFLSFLSGRAGLTVERTGGQFAPAAAVLLFGSGSRANDFANEAGTVTAWTRSPATVTATTRSIYIETTIANFFGASACTISLRMNLVREPALP